MVIGCPVVVGCHDIGGDAWWWEGWWHHAHSIGWDSSVGGRAAVGACSAVGASIVAGRVSTTAVAHILNLLIIYDYSSINERISVGASCAMPLQEPLETLEELLVERVGGARHDPEAIVAASHNGQREQINVLFFEQLANELLIRRKALELAEIYLYCQVESSACLVRTQCFEILR